MKSLIDTSLLDALPRPGGTTPGIGEGMPGVTPSQPFVWGQGGSRLDPRSLAAQRDVAQALAMPDYSPVQHWLQGAARLASNAVGTRDLNRIDRAEREASAADSAVVDAIMAGDQGAISAGIGSNNPAVARAAQMVWKQQNPDPVAPHYWETNNGSLGVIGPDGSPRIAYEDPTPKINWIQADNADGTKSLIPVGPNGPIGQTGGGDPASGGMGASIPSGSPLAGASNSKVIGGKQYWNIGGEWYDNPEGQ